VSSAQREASADRQRLVQLLLERRRAAAASGAGRPDGALAVSLFFFSSDIDDRPQQKYELVLACAELADQLGLYAIWVPERHFDEFGAPYPSPAVLLSAIAARTQRIQLRAGSVVLPLRDPLLVAEEWGMLDAISHGRAGLSLAPGWHTNDFVLNPTVFERRKAELVERLAVLYQLWGGASIERPGPDGRDVEVRSYPRPDRVPEIWLTSSANVATWQSAGELNINVLSALLEQSVEELAGKVRSYYQALAEAGHPSSARQVTCMVHTHLAEDAGVVEGRVRGPLTRYLSAHLDLFAKFAAHGSVGVRPEDLTEDDRAILLAHGVRRYISEAGLFGSAETCRPMLDRLIGAGVTELACLVDFGLPDEQVLESVREIGKVQAALHSTAQAPR